MKTRALFALAVPALILAACSDEPASAPLEENVADFEIEEPILNRPDPLPEPSPLPTETPTPTPTPPPLPDDEQVQFDAEATGMTARVDRSSAEPTEEPVEPVRD